MNTLMNVRRSCISVVVAVAIAAAFTYARYREPLTDPRLARIKAERLARHQANRADARTLWRSLRGQ